MLGEMKVLFLDIDGVVNCAKTVQRYGGVIGIDPYMALLVGRIVEATGAKIVLSSSWRHWPQGREEIRKRVMPFIDTTSIKGVYLPTYRGLEILEWLNRHPEVERYAILDDDSDFHPSQQSHFFKTEWNTGLTDLIADQVIKHLNQ